ncbi:transcriptional regulator [Pseudoalteromonas carrageenovora]|uniref:Transcription antitermination protein RfaH n=1 Tax=Pseudoalteromonas carrageenovora IAM 12662 TaxID=1314868 RepID=A0A2K4X610_PSEVC|nr:MULTISPECIES: transcription/translation regulatory transformer protein RfaH [Pseudoalteromonas]KTF16411.1 transcriptional regulator [Pseudoalteromonas sp. H103]MBE0381936.1 transcriptional antiterminator RfaH [Pseudoalteromonas carrageenovora IAM 12662]MDO6635786.1 transcription/translation regulatory transformer protein RfaH [Pseudoalteromonas carrageenovora]MDO6647779.1 transcription/translation regulatory transformer protein RfaH [Pseudoalteromonas carrageenovora]QBJ70681.1 transcription
MESWYLVLCKPRQEERAQTNLHNQGIKAFYPKLTTEKLIKGRRTLKQSALFPNYLFVCLESQNGNFSAVKNTRGINGFVSYGANYQIVPNKLIEQLQCERSQTLESTLPKSGDVVNVSSASFKNIQAIYKEPDGDVRSILLINLLNKPIQMSVDNKDIEF